MAFKVISLFAGIGGICLGFRQAGFEIVWANDNDSAACRTYRQNLGDSYLVEMDIRKISAEKLPEFDVLSAGFPCQPFSIAGSQKGFLDKRGNLFFEISRIVDARRPKVIFLENVANLVNHDNGRTFLVIYNSLVQFGYNIYYKIMAADQYGNLPQIRKRIYVIAVRDDLAHITYHHPEPIKLTLFSSDIINRKQKQDDSNYYTGDMYKYLADKMWYRNAIYRITDTEVRPTKNMMCPTLTANMGTYPDRVPVIWDAFGIRKLTLRECLDFQGFPSWFTFPANVSIADAYKQLGNTVCIPLVRRIAHNIYVLMENALSV